MALERKFAQGVCQIIRFNWQFYAIAFGCCTLLVLVANIVPQSLKNSCYVLAILGCYISLFSLIFSFYIYDLSALYKLPWLANLKPDDKILILHAGFDETSKILRQYHRGKITIADFYDPAKHTEISIKRARKAFPPSEDTISIKTENIVFDSGIFDQCILMFSAHEVRNKAERIKFFEEIRRILKDNGTIYVTEHLRDFPNFMAYSVGFLHFFSKQEWQDTFAKAKLTFARELKTTAFVSTFILRKDGNTP